MKPLLVLTLACPMFAVACTDRSSVAAPSSAGEAASSTNAAQTVIIKQMAFAPATLTVKPGDIVEWKNEDIVAHTATAATFDSGPIAPGQSWRHTFTQSSSNAYHCTFHPNMKGTIVIQ